MSEVFSKEFCQKNGLSIFWLNSATDDEMSLSEHLEEFSQRLLFSLLSTGALILFAFSNINELVRGLQSPANGIRFLQFVPGEYVFTSLRVSIFCGFLVNLPLFIYQISLYILPGLTKKEKTVVVPVIIGLLFLFSMGIIFSFKYILPTALSFFINYGADVVEPLWSFDQYFSFLSTLVLTTGLIFLLPMVQLFVGFLGIYTGQQMLAVWRYVLVCSTVLAAIVTPSTDPITQLIMTLALFVLYLLGVALVITLCQ